MHCVQFSDVNFHEILNRSPCSRKETDTSWTFGLAV